MTVISKLIDRLKGLQIETTQLSGYWNAQQVKTLLLWTRNLVLYQPILSGVNPAKYSHLLRLFFAQVILIINPILHSSLLSIFLMLVHGSDV